MGLKLLFKMYSSYPSDLDQSTGRNGLEKTIYQAILPQLPPSDRENHIKNMSDEVNKCMAYIATSTDDCDQAEACKENIKTILSDLILFVQNT